MTTAEIVETVLRLGGTLKLDGDSVRCSLPAVAAHLAGDLRDRKAGIITLLREQNSWPEALSYAEHYCRMRAAGFAPCSREEWEAAHGSGAERMARYERMCRWGASGEVLQ